MKKAGDLGVNDIIEEEEYTVAFNEEAEEELSNNERVAKDLLENIATQETSENGETMDSWFQRTVAQFLDASLNKMDPTYALLLGWVQQDPSRRPRDAQGRIVEVEGFGDDDRKMALGTKKDYSKLEYMEVQGLVRNIEGTPLFFGKDDYEGGLKGAPEKSYRYTPVMAVDKTLLPFDQVPTKCAEVLQWQDMVQGGQRIGFWEVTPPRARRPGEEQEDSYKEREVRFKELYRYCYIRRTPMRFSMFQSARVTKAAQEAAAAGAIKVEHSAERPSDLKAAKWDGTDHVRLTDLPVWGGDSEKYAAVMAAVNVIFLTVLAKTDDAGALGQRAEVQRRQAETTQAASGAPAASGGEEGFEEGPTFEGATFEGAGAAEGGDLFSDIEDEDDDGEDMSNAESSGSSDEDIPDTDIPDSKRPRIKAKAGSKTMSDRLRMLVLE